MKFLPKSDRIPAVTVRELARHLAETFDRVEEGEALLVIRRGRPIATIQPLEQFVVRRAVEQRTTAEGDAATGNDAAPSVSPPDLTDVQWAVLEGVASDEHSDLTIRKIGDDTGAYMNAIGHLELNGFVGRPGGFRWQPTVKGLEALDSRNGESDVS